MRTVFSICFFFFAASLGAQTNQFLIQNGDRIALVGDTLVEREQKYGYVESRFHLRFSERKFVVRNLGWSGDTPAGESRASFDFAQAGKGFERLMEQLRALQPTVVFLGYGMASSFDGEKGLPKFKKDLAHLADAIQNIKAGNGARLVFLGPVRHEKLPAPFPDPAAHNALLAAYEKAIKEVADQHQSIFISLGEIMGDGTVKNHPYTDDGIHLTAAGYSWMADAIEVGLGWSANRWRFGVTAEGEEREGGYGIKVSDLHHETNRVSFTALEDFLPNPVAFEGGEMQTATEGSRLQFQKLAPGEYVLKIDGEPVLHGGDMVWNRSTNLSVGPSAAQSESLRQAIISKNELFFHRWRPENETYLFGFRKHEQGQNAREIAMFDPLIADAEKKIQGLAAPRKHRFELEIGPATSSRKKSEAALKAPEKVSATTLPDFEVAEGFEVNLFAEDPQLAKPIQMNFDGLGRLWIASSSVYPQIQPGQKANDKILVVEDTDGDGKADRSTVFVDGLLIPTGVEPGDGGVYVGQSTELLHFKAKGLSNKADVRRVVLSGFGTEDTHHIVHTLRWGQDGQLYFNQSIYIHSHLETPHGVVRLNSGGLFHLRPPTMELGVFLRGFCNPWGHDFDEFGQSFVTDGAGFQGISYGIPGATYFTYAEMRREMKSISPGNYPKFAGLERIESEHFPAEWQGNLITCDFRAHRVVRFGVSEQGGGYITKEMPDLLRSTNVTFRPIDVKLGPDGALYVADWSNPIIQHGEVDFRDPRRDHEHGRIWRITAKGRPLQRRVAFKMLSNMELLDHLLSPNAYTRKQAGRALTERGTVIKPDLDRWTEKQKEEKHLLRALWMYQSIDQAEPDLLKKLCQAQDGHIRAAAYRVASFWRNRLKAPLEILKAGVADPFPRARIEALRALAAIKTAESAAVALTVVEGPMDPFLEYAAWLTINDLAEPWVEAIQEGTWNAAGKEKQLEYGLGAIEPARASLVLGKLLGTKPMARNGQGPWIELVGKAGDVKALQSLWDQTRGDGFDPSVQPRALGALEEAARLRKLRPQGDLAPIGKFLQSEDDRTANAAARVAGSWKITSAVPALLKLASRSSSTVTGAVESLRQIGGSPATAGLAELAANGARPEIRREAGLGLLNLDPQKAGPVIARNLTEMKTEEEALAFWRRILTTKNTGPVIAKAVGTAQLSEPVTRAGLRAAREGSRKEPELELALARFLSRAQDAEGPSDGEMLELARMAREKGDPVRGERLFRRPELGCVTCHAIGGAGGKVGPDLTSIGASAQMDYLVESIFYPNRKIKEGYHSVIIQTRDEQELSGLLLRETPEEIFLRDVTDKEVSIPKNKIQSRQLGASLMPSGLIDGLKAEEKLDLFRFLSELGKPGPFDASKPNVARVWRVRPATHTSEQFGAEKITLQGADWGVVYSLVSGALAQSDLQGATYLANPNRYTGIVGLYLATRFQSAKAGRARLQVEGAGKFECFIDGKAVPPAAGGVSADLTAGEHLLLLRLDPRQLPENFKVSSPDVMFLNN